MAQNVLVADEIEAGRRFIERVARRVPVKAAIWMRHEEFSEWLLYIASDEFRGGHSREAYAVLREVYGETPEPRLPWMTIDMMAGDDPRVLDAVWRTTRYPQLDFFWLRGENLGAQPYDEAYIYAASALNPEHESAPSPA